MSNDLSRRQMLMMSALAVAAFTPIGSALGAEKGGGIVDAGNVADYSDDGIYNLFVEKGFFLIRKDGKLVAQSARCTHKNGKLTPVKDGFICKLHNSTFSPDGKVQRPPAKTNLVRFAISADDKKRVIVNLGKRFETAQFDLPEASISVS